MNKKILYTDFSSTDDIIQELLSSKKMQKAVKRKNLFDMWKNAVDKKFADKSKPYSMMGKTLIIACENSSVAQELLLRKNQILSKLKPYLEGLKLNVSEIKFDTKRWSDN